MFNRIHYVAKKQMTRSEAVNDPDHKHMGNPAKSVEGILMINSQLGSGKNDNLEITAVCDYLAQLPPHLFGPKYSLLDLLQNFFFGWTKPVEPIFRREAALFSECAPYVNYLSELASPSTLNFLKAKFELEKDIEMANHKGIIDLYKNLALVAIAGIFFLHLYELTITILNYTLVQAGQASIIAFMVLLTCFVFIVIMFLVA